MQIDGDPRWRREERRAQEGAGHLRLSQTDIDSDDVRPTGEKTPLNTTPEPILLQLTRFHTSLPREESGPTRRALAPTPASLCRHRTIGSMVIRPLNYGAPTVTTLLANLSVQCLRQRRARRAGEHTRARRARRNPIGPWDSGAAAARDTTKKRGEATRKRRTSHCASAVPRASSRKDGRGAGPKPGQ